jgi:hypothetical protein
MARWKMTVREFRRMAAAMDLRILQLTAEGVHGPAMIGRMVGHLPDLQQIWVGTSDNQLAMLCDEFPGFRRYASLMEEAAEAERKKVTPHETEIYVRMQRVDVMFSIG